MSYFLSKYSAAICTNGQTINVTSDHPAWSEIELALLQGDEEQAAELSSIEKSIVGATVGTGLEVSNGEVYYNGERLFGAAVDALLDTISRAEKHGVKPYVEALMNFITRAQANPSMRARTDLYRFLDAGGFTLIPDGRFLAYKKVIKGADGKLYDIHTRSIDNSVGVTVPRMDRSKVDDDPTRTCSYGYHVCSQEYLPHFGGGSADTVVYVAVDPADVVAIPIDYNLAKMRVCQYEVLGERSDLLPESERDLPSGLTTYWSFEDPDDEDYDEDYDEFDDC